MRLATLREAIENDLERLDFVTVIPDKAKVMREAYRAWDSVWTEIPESKFDAEEALKCYALERNTAVVFHSMRGG